MSRTAPSEAARPEAARPEAARPGTAPFGTAPPGAVEDGGGGAGSRPSGPSSRSRGPHAGQHTGWAWKRRSAGSRYSRSQSPHMANPAIVVFGLSYGRSVTMVNRGPQFVQLTNG